MTKTTSQRAIAKHTKDASIARAMGLMMSYGIDSNKATKISDLMNNALYVTINKHGFSVHGLLNNDKLFMLVWSDGKIEVGGQGNASSFTVSDVL